LREVGQASKVPWTLKKGGAEKKKDGTDGRTRRRARPEIVPRFGDRLAAAATPASRPPARARTRTQARAANRSVSRRAGGLGHDRASATGAAPRPAAARAYVWNVPWRRGRGIGARDRLPPCLPARPPLQWSKGRAQLPVGLVPSNATAALCFVLICPWTWSIRHVTSSTAHVRN